jgi:hypothetical protein
VCDWTGSPHNCTVECPQAHIPCRCAPTALCSHTDVHPSPALLALGGFMQAIHSGTGWDHKTLCYGYCVIIAVNLVLGVLFLPARCGHATNVFGFNHYAATQGSFSLWSSHPRLL